MHSAQGQNHHVQPGELQNRVASLLHPGFGSGLQPRTEILSYDEEGPHTGSEPDQREDRRPVRIALLQQQVDLGEECDTPVSVFISDIDMYNKNNAVELKVNGMPFQISNQIYQHPTGNFQNQYLLSDNFNCLKIYSTFTHTRPHSHETER